MEQARWAWKAGLFFCLTFAVIAACPPAEAQWQIKTEDGQGVLKFGLLAQPQAEWLQPAGAGVTAQNLFLRRLRVLLGGKIGEKITFFVETDSPNLGKGKDEKAKDEGDVYIQDAVLTYNFSDQLKIDSGMILTPFSYNHGQGATTLLPLDYGPVSFVESKPLTSRVGRDYGVQVRGYLADHFEYRAGVFQGLRDQGATVPFRYAARIVWYPFDIEKGLFYSGTYLGKKKLLALGAGYDHQDEFDAVTLDAFLELPLNGGDALTLQAAYSAHDGGAFVTSIPEQQSWYFEGGYFFSQARLSPFLQLHQRNFEASAQPGDASTRIGLAWWIKGHNCNLKVSWGSLQVDDQDDGEQLVLQFQVFQF